MPLSEILTDGSEGSLEKQIHEAGADSYAAYHLMGNWVGGAKRPQATKILKIDGMPTRTQDEIIFSCIVVALGGFMLHSPVSQLDGDIIYKFEHPPTAARLNSLMQTAVDWCRQNRPDIEAWMTNDRFLRLLTSAAEVIWGLEDERYGRWEAQVKFLRSADGVTYLRKLQKGLNAYRAAL